MGDVPKISSALVWADRWGGIKARWGVGRMHYTVDPGLYALGDPDDQSPVLVTANYKMSFDRLREALPGRNAWILVLNTQGINVWCAAGKGTFGTDELVQRIELSGLIRVVSHREVILPQLAGPGVAAYTVRKRSGFKAIYGPIRAADLPAFLDAGLKATPGMRRKDLSCQGKGHSNSDRTRECFKMVPGDAACFFSAGRIGSTLRILERCNDRWPFCCAQSAGSTGGRSGFNADSSALDSGSRLFPERFDHGPGDDPGRYCFLGGIS